MARHKASTSAKLRQSHIDLQRRAQIGLNKGEAHHALKRAVSFNRRGEIRDRTSESQQHRIASLNLLIAIIIYWNTWKLGETVAKQVADGEDIDSSLLPMCHRSAGNT